MSIFNDPDWLAKATAAADNRFAAANLCPGKWYAIADEEGEPLTLYKCEDIDGELCLAMESNAIGEPEHGDFVPARAVFCQTTVCVPQG